MTALGAEPFRFTFQPSTGADVQTSVGRDQLVGTSKATYSATTTLTLRGERDDLDMIDVVVLTGPPEYVDHTTVGFGIMQIVAKLASEAAFVWLKPLLEGGVRTITPGMMHTHDAGRLRLVLSSGFIGPHIQIGFTITPSRKQTTTEE